MKFIEINSWKKKWERGILYDKNTYFLHNKVFSPNNYPYIRQKSNKITIFVWIIIHTFL